GRRQDFLTLIPCAVQCNVSASGKFRIMTTLALKAITVSRSMWIGLHLAAFLSGFLTMALEMLIGRTFTPYFGGTIYTWGALISVFLTGMTLGYMIGGKAADRWPAIPIVAALFVAAAATVVIVPLYGEDAINRI